MTQKQIKIFIDYLCRTYDNSTVIIDISEFPTEFKEIQEYLMVGTTESKSIRLKIWCELVAGSGTATESLWYLTEEAKWLGYSPVILVTKKDLHQAYGGLPECLRLF